MSRDFVVCLKFVTYDDSSKKFLTKYENINVLVGPQSAITALEKEIREFLAGFKGSFKTNFQTRAMF